MSPTDETAEPEQWQADLGRRLAAARKARGYTQLRAAVLAGFGPQVISDYETGRVKRPSFEVISKLSDVYGIAIDLPTRLEREDFVEMPGVTEYFRRHEAHASMTSARVTKYPNLRAHVNATLNAQAGDLPYRTVRTVIDDMIEALGYQ